MSDNDKAAPAFRSFWSPAVGQQATAASQYEFQGLAQPKQQKDDKSKTGAESAQETTNVLPPTETAPLLPKTSLDSSESEASWLSRNIIYIVGFIFLFAGLLYLLYLFLFPVIIPPYIPSNSNLAAICNPFDFNPRPTVHLKQGYGITAQINYLPDDQALRYSVHSVVDYAKNSIPLNQTFYFRNINTPTRLFTDRFQAYDRDGNGFSIEGEYFYVKLDTMIGLQENDKDKTGLYQFALISDDGSIAYIDTQTPQTAKSFQTLINNDGTHSSRLITSDYAVDFSSTQLRYPLQIHYYQGPAAHIALVLLWRQLNNAHLEKEKFEGLTGNDEFWIVHNNNTASTPTVKYEELLNRGWNPVSEWNFYLPNNFDPLLRKQIENSEYDPCQDQTDYKPNQ